MSDDERKAYERLKEVLDDWALDHPKLIRMDRIDHFTKNAADIIFEDIFQIELM